MALLTRVRCELYEERGCIFLLFPNDEGLTVSRNPTSTEDPNSTKYDRQVVWLVCVI